MCITTTFIADSTSVQIFGLGFMVFTQPLTVNPITVSSVPSRVRSLRKTRDFWANFTDFEPGINIIKCKTEKLEYFNARL